MSVPVEASPLSSSPATVSPVFPGRAAPLHLDAVSDYVPAPDEGLALDYGPAPDNEAAQDYGKAIDYDALPAGAAAQPSTQAQDAAAGQVVTTAQDGATTAEDATTAAPAADPVAGPGGAASPDAEPWAAGYEAGWVSPATYWRRRAVALVLGIAVLTVLAWAVSGVLHGSGAGQVGHGKHGPAQPRGAHQHGSSTNSGRTRGHPGRRSSPQSLPAPSRAITGHAHAGRQGASHVLASRLRAGGARFQHDGPGTLSGVSDVLTAAGSRQRVAAAASRTAPPKSAGRAPHPQGVPRARNPRGTAPRVAPCARGDVVLSLLSPRYWYERGRWPLFGVDAVSTGDRPCRFDMGSRAATVVVSTGRTRIWGSADCVRGTGLQPVVLHRGVPAVRWIYWDRATSIPGCRRPGIPVHQGAYTAIAFDGQLSSQVMVFLLGRSGTFLP